MVKEENGIMQTKHKGADMAIFAANFKCNLTRAQTKAYIEGLESYMSRTQSVGKREVFVFPNQAALLENTYDFVRVGAQNAHCVENGGFTGEIGAQQLREFGIDSILIGHSERRTIFGESQEYIAQKFAYFAKAGFRIIYCIGEDLAVRQNGSVEEFLRSEFRGIDTTYENLIVAYEPIWAIGTGVSASLEDIERTHKFLRSFLDVPLLYGGSVNETNAGEILCLANVDGVLVGSASLELTRFCEIIDSKATSDTAESK